MTSSSASSATGSSGMYAHATCQRTIASTANSTMLCRKKCTSVLPTAASGRISRGNDTFFTRPALATTDDVAVAEPRREQVPDEQARQQPDRERRDARAEDDAERDVEDDEVEQRVEQRPREPEDAVLVLDLQLLADHPDEQLAVLDDPHQALPGGDAGPDDPSVSRLAASFASVVRRRHWLRRHVAHVT